MRKQTSSLGAAILDFVERNPKVAADLAFQLGVLAGETVNETSRLLKKKTLIVPRHLPETVVKVLSGAAHKYLPGASPKRQPGRPARAKRPARHRQGKA
ncbi:MAG: hypothetical protein ACR2K5_11105 [Pseudolabrys sp.]